MSQLRLVTDYKDVETYRQSFIGLAKMVFGIDFENWHREGCWDDRYTCYSYVDGNQVVANISTNKMDLIVDGERKKALQIGTVMTRPDYRKRGLSRALMEHILEKEGSRYELIFLFANETVSDFYPKFGFKPYLETRFSLGVNLARSNGGGIRKLDTSNPNDRNLIFRAARERRPISRVLGVENAHGILLFYLFNGFEDAFYYSEEEKAVLIYAQRGKTLHLIDIISQHKVDVNGLLPRIVQDETGNVVFHFTPDLFDFKPETEILKADDSTFFVLSSGDFLKKAFKYPVTAQA